MLIFLTVGCFVCGYVVSFLISQSVYKQHVTQIGNAASDGYFLNCILAGLANILFYERDESIFEVSVNGEIFKVFKDGNDIKFEVKT